MHALNLNGNNGVKELPYVVLIGNVGAGKSKLVERLAGEYGLTSRGGRSCTKEAVVYQSRSKKLFVYDTPGCNPIVQKYEHSLWLAQV